MIKIKKLRKITETMLTGNQENNMKLILKNIKENLDDFSYDGDIEEFKVLKSNSKNLFGIYALQNENNDIVAFFQVLEKSNDIGELNLVYVSPEARGNKLTEKFILFMKRILGYSKILLGDRFSPDMLQFVKNIQKRFIVNWTNGKELEPFNDENIEKYASYMEPTGWQVILENSTDMTKYPRYYGENGKLSESFYSCYID